MRYFFVGLGRAVWWGLLLPLAIGVCLLRTLGGDPRAEAQIPADLAVWGIGLIAWSICVLLPVCLVTGIGVAS